MFDLVLGSGCCALPTPEEQALKEQEALDKLRHFILDQGGAWDDGWQCRMRFRMTARRNGKMGRTTDNYYFSPCGQSFRNYRQVAEFLGLNVDGGVRGKPGPKAGKRPAAAATHPAAAPGAAAASVATPSASGASSGTRVAGVAARSSGGSGACSGGAAGYDCALSAAPAKRARTKASVVLRRGPATAPRLMLAAAASLATRW